MAAGLSFQPVALLPGLDLPGLRSLPGGLFRLLEELRRLFLGLRSLLGDQSVPLSLGLSLAFLGCLPRLGQSLCSLLLSLVDLAERF